MIAGLPDARHCTEAERAALLTHLFEDRNAHWCANPLAARHLVAWVTTIRDRDRFGAIQTNFADLGTVLAKDVVYRDRYLVREVAGILARPDCTDDQLRAAIASRIEAERSGTLKHRVSTALLTPGGLVLCDGHKRAIAIYEASSPQDFAVPIHILTET